MKLWSRMAAIAVATAMLWGGAMLAEVQAANCDPVRYPPKVEGQVLKVDKHEGKVRVQTAEGTIHEFQASKETLQELKAGDRISAKLRNAPNC